MMGREVRTTGIGIVGDVPWGTHLCQFYKTKEDLTDILVPYFKAGLENNEFCMWVTSEPLRAEEAKKALAEKVKDLDAYVAKGQIEIFDYSQWYTRSGGFDAEKVLQGWVEKERQARKNGFDGLRLTGNTLWLEEEQWREFTEYEAAVNSVIGKYRMLAICTYCLDKCGASQVVDVACNHEFALIRREGRWEIIESRKHKETVEALRQSEEKFRLAFENAVDAIFWADPETGLITNCNRAAEILLGKDKVDVVGRHETTLHPADKEAYYRDLFSQHATTGRMYAGDAEVVSKSGKIKPVSITASVTSVGGRRIIQGIFRDITERRKAEEALAASREQYRALFEQAPDAIVLVDGETGTFVDFNDKAPENLGYSREEFRKLKIADIDVLESEQRVLQHAKKVVAEGADTFETRMRTRSGEIRDVLVSARSICLYGKKFISSVWRDITEHKQAQAALRESEEKFRNLAEQSPNMIFINKGGRVVYANEGCERVMGYKREEFYSPDFDFLTLVAEEHRESMTANFRRHMRGEDVLPLEYALITKGGRRIEAILTTKLLKYDGEWAILGIVTDITGRKKTEEELKSSEQKLRPGGEIPLR
ncbi:MAG: PAS domain S-box protein [Planctomycetota bacterium]|jgi:PAS domain S-box-containing protein